MALVKSARSEYGTDWRHTQSERGTYSYEQVHAILLQEIRDELKRLNALLHCSNFTQLPQVVRRLDRRLSTKMPLPQGRKKGGV